MPQSGQFYPYQFFLTSDPTTYFQDNIERFIPAMYQTGEFEGTIALFKTVIAPILDEMYQRYSELPKLSDIDRCPPKFLQLLAGNINVLTVEDTFDETQPVGFRRRELGKMVDVFKLRGVPSSFLRILKYQGADDYGLIVPRKNLMLLDITPVSGAPVGEVNDVGEPLAPQFFDISVLADGAYDGTGTLIGSRISYALTVPVVRSAVKLFWNLHEVPLQHEHPDGLIERSFFFDRANSTLTTNFIPLIGDTVVVEVVGDPNYLQTFRMADRMYWRPGTEEVYSDHNPLLRVEALEDRRPIGTLLYFAWLAKFFWTKCFPHPPAIDTTRVGYSPLLPPHEALTWNWQMDCNSPDPWFFQFSNGYGFEAFWEARSSYQLSRQYPFEASMRESAPRTLALSRERSIDVTVTLDGRMQPWLVSLNPSKGYGTPTGSLTPLIVSLPSGSNRTMTVQRLSGTVQVRSGEGFHDGIGSISMGAADAHGGIFSQFFPSKWINHASYPVYEGSIIGAFADDAGVVVGTPFWVGNGPMSFSSIPDDATKLQLGINDDQFQDNQGSFQVRVQALAVPTGDPVYGSAGPHHRKLFKFQMRQEP